MAQKGNLYPTFAIKQNKNPSHFFAIPVLGFLVKGILLLPVAIEGFFLAVAFLFFWVINSFVILFTGKYWDAAYDFFLGLMSFGIKIYAYILGLTDKYPGFRLGPNGVFTLSMDKPKNPNRLFAIPLFGMIIRFLLLIPYSIFSSVMTYGSWVAMVVSWFPILTKNRFPESTYEFEQDTLRVKSSAYCYITGLSDSYPSFHISMNHQTIKILLLIAGAILAFGNMKGGFPPLFTRHPYQYRYQRTYMKYNYQKNMMPAY